MPEFDFDTVIDRRAVPALKHHRIVLGEDGMDLFPAGVADMDFRVAPCIAQAIARRAVHGVFGYETVPSGLMPALTGWLRARHGWAVDPDHILRAPNVLNALAMAANLFTKPGDGIIVQPPVFFDFADIIAENGRRMVENPLILRDGRYEMDFDELERTRKRSGDAHDLSVQPAQSGRAGLDAGRAIPSWRHLSLAMTFSWCPTRSTATSPFPATVTRRSPRCRLSTRQTRSPVCRPPRASTSPPAVRPSRSCRTRPDAKPSKPKTAA